MEYFVAWVIYASFVIFVLGTYIREWRKNTDGKNNLIYSQDGMRVTYVYFVPHTKEQITEILSHKNAGDRLCYMFDRGSMVIKFADPEEEYYNREFSGDDYHLSFEEQGSSCLLHVERMNYFAPSSSKRVPLLMNAFWKVKVNASVYQI
ncbi:MAG: hypothetical protein HDQ97_04840 [Lachnospiraceae bacterium]|nr:hypothetical protein [Lachnospiraceae bacterium]